MSLFIFTLIAFVIVLPLLYFAPLGISMKAKMVLAALSFLLTVFTLLASSLYPFRLVALMTLLILGFSAYFFDKRFGPLLFAQVDGEEVILKNETVFSSKEDHEEVHNEMNTTPTNEKSSLLTDLEQIETQELSIEILNEETIMTVQDSIETIEEDTITEFFELEVDEDQLDHPEEDRLAELTDHEKAFFTIEKVSEESMDVQEEGIVLNDEVSDSLNDLEKLLYDFEEDHVETKKEERLTNELPDADITNIEQEDDYLEKIYESLLNDQEGIVEEHLIDSSKEVSSTLEQEQTRMDDELEDEFEMTRDPIEESFNEEWNVQEDLSTMSSDHDRLVDSLNSDMEEERLNPTKQALLKTVFAEIDLYQSKLNSEEFEEYLTHFLHLSLSDKDYYCFAKVLMEHYISNGQSEKLKQFVNKIEPRFKKYPYLSNELAFLKELSIA